MRIIRSLVLPVLISLSIIASITLGIVMPAGGAGSGDGLVARRSIFRPNLPDQVELALDRPLGLLPRLAISSLV